MLFKKLIFAIIVCLSFSVLGLVSGQEEEIKNLYMVWEMKVDPAMDKEFREAVKEMVAKDVKHKLGYSYFTHASSDFLYTVFCPLKDYSDWDNYSTAWQRVQDAMGKEKHEAIYNRLYNTTEYFNIYTLRFRPDLSNMPKNPRLATGQEKFFKLDIMYPKLRKIKEFEAAMKKVVSFSKKEKNPEKIRAYVREIGADCPMYIFALSGSSKLDYYEANRKMWENASDERRKAFSEMLKLLRKRESRDIWDKPELSYYAE